MAKKKHKGALPKKIAGVKVPKALRKGGLIAFLASPSGRALLSQALVLAGAVKKTGEAVADHASDSAGSGGLKGAAAALVDNMRSDDKGASTAGATLAYALGEAASAFVQALNDHHARHADWEPEVEVEASADGSKKKPSSSPSAAH